MSSPTMKPEGIERDRSTWLERNALWVALGLLAVFLPVALMQVQEPTVQTVADDGSGLEGVSAGPNIYPSTPEGHLRYERDMMAKQRETFEQYKKARAGRRGDQGDIPAAR